MVFQQHSELLKVLYCLTVLRPYIALFGLFVFDPSYCIVYFFGVSSLACFFQLLSFGCFYCLILFFILFYCFCDPFVKPCFHYVYFTI